MMGTTAPKKPGEIITFYSYKGGTGRTMGLANVAWILASNGKSVLVVDWDLEAPGLHRYFHPFLLDKELKSTSGVLDMLWDFALAALDQDADTRPGWHEPYANPLQHAVSLRWEFPADGHIDLLGAGRQNKSFGQRVNSFDWHSFYSRLGGSTFIASLRQQMRDHYDYVLIDSRTGLSDTSGLCTIQLPDTLVACFTMSTQSISGCASVVESVLRQRGDHPVRILPVPMRVESGETDRLEESRDWAQWSFRRAFAEVPTGEVERYWGDVEVPYRSLYAYEELLAPIGDRPQQEDTLLSAFERLTGYLTRDTVNRAVPIDPEQRSALRHRYRQRPHGRVKYDFFLSYAVQDRPWADWIAAQLANAGYLVTPDAAPGAGETWAYDLRNAEADSAKVLALLSPDSHRSEWVRAETARATVTSVGREDPSDRLLQIRVSQFGVLDATPARRVVVDIAGLSEKQARENLLQAVLNFYGRPMANRGPRADSRKSPRYPDAHPEIWEVPAPTLPFVGRERELLRMLDHFRDDGSPFAVSGMAGSGKTSLAVEFANRVRGNYGGAVLVRPEDIGRDSDDELAALAALRTISPRLHRGGSGIPTDPGSDVRALVVLDGFDNVSLTEELARALAPYHVIVTGRRHATAIRHGIRLEVFSRAEATELLSRFAPKIPPGAADQIAMRLGFLPVALSIAANQLSVSGSSVGDFLALLDSRLDQVVLRAGGDSGHSLMARFQETYDKLSARDPAAAHMLRLLAMAAPHSLPDSLLTRDPSVFAQPLRKAVKDPEGLSHTIGILITDNLAERKRSNLRTHPVLAAVIRANLPPDEQEKITSELTRMLVANDPGDPSDAATWPVYRSLMPLVNSVHWPTESGFRELLLRLCWFQLSAGNPLTAKDLADRVVKRFELLLGTVHEDTLAGLHMVALCDWELGNAKRAEAVLRRLNAAREQLLGASHPVTLASRNNLAATLAGQGKWAEAVELHREILEERTARLGSDHSDTLVSAGNLASSLCGVEEFEEAHRIETSVWEKRVELFGQLHPASLASADNLAFIQEKRGEFANAVELRHMAWAGRRKIMGNQHPETLRCAASLVSVLLVVGKNDEASSIARSINEDMKKVFGPDSALSRRVDEVAGDHG
ncbi:FxSxx-COOH system tetratricopeptide repeat protein [Streptomyces sp. NPDC006923]|uniref:FxSxx-COOH system tetratricopeptide repeat protein n=1 Tax=Streptomyces sp. NPDC006923 TaxID=3155355 RepID=UPI0033DEC23F